MNQFDAVKESLPSHRYTLLGVINHTGKLETGHYTSFVKVRGEVNGSESVLGCVLKLGFDCFFLNFFLIPFR